MDEIEKLKQEIEFIKEQYEQLTQDLMSTKSMAVELIDRGNHLAFLTLNIKIGKEANSEEITNAVKKWRATVNSTKLRI